MKSKKLQVVTTINGKFVKRGDDKISVFDNSLLYAEGLFETLLTIDGKIIFFDEHFTRLTKGASVLGIKIPVTKKLLKDWMTKTVKRHSDRITKLRLTVTSGEAARWVGVQGKQQVILSASPHTIPEKSFELLVSPFRVDQDSVFRRIKTISYAIHAAALTQAKKHKCDDALMLNEKNEVAEVTSANIFWVSKGEVFTTPLSSGCLEGITRKIVMEQSQKIGYKIQEKNINLSGLLKADEVFISSSLKLIAPVAAIKSKNRIHKLKCGKITENISNHFTNYVTSSKKIK